MQQKTHQVSSDGFPCKSIKDAQKKEKTPQNHLSGVRFGNEDRSYNGSKATWHPETLPQMIRKGGINM